MRQDLGIAILDACKMRGHSLFQLCAAAGLKYSTLHAQIRNGREIPFSTVERLANALALPIEHFASAPISIESSHFQSSTLLGTKATRALADLVTEQVAAMSELNYRISTDDVLDWLAANDSRLVNHGWLIDKINLYYPAQPDDEIPRPYKIGEQSLSSRYFRMLSVDSYAAVMSKFDAASRREIIQAHLDVAGKKYLITDRKIDAISEEGRIHGTYRRLLAPVTTADGQRFTLAFSKLTHFPGR